MCRFVWLLLLFPLPSMPKFADGQTRAPISSPNVQACQLVAPKPANRVYVSEAVQTERILHMVQPGYPPEATAKGIQGNVILRVVVGKDGTVKEIHLVRGSTMLVEAAITAVWQWRYQPLS